MFQTYGWLPFWLPLLLGKKKKSCQNGKNQDDLRVIHSPPQVVHKIRKTVENIVDNLRRSGWKPQNQKQTTPKHKTPKTFWFWAFGAPKSQNPKACGTVGSPKVEKLVLGGTSNGTPSWKDADMDRNNRRVKYLTGANTTFKAYGMNDEKKKKNKNNLEGCGCSPFFLCNR